MIRQVEYNGFTFTNDNANLEEFVGAGLPSIRVSEESKSQQDGSIATGYKFGSRTFGWSGRISGATNEAYVAVRRALMLALNMQNKPVEGMPMVFTLINDDELTLRNVRIIADNFDYAQSEPSIVWNRYQVTFRAAFPFFEGTESDVTQSKTEIDAGVVVPAPVPAPLAGLLDVLTATDPQILTNAGNANAYPVYTITGPGTGFTISNLTTNKEMYINETLLAGDTISIDTWTQDVTKNGSSIVDKISGSFLVIQPGANGLAFGVGSGDSALTTTLQTVFKDTYIGF